MRVLSSRSALFGIVLAFALGCAVRGQNASDSVSRVAGSVGAKQNSRAVRCKDASGNDRRLCEFVGYRDDEETIDEFELTISEIDLNGDSVKEVVAWESSWAGTSGAMLWILAIDRGHYRKLFESEMTWSPILVLPSKHHGWRDITYLVTGGGAKTVFVTITHNGRSYADGARVNRKQPLGQVLIEKKWTNTLFGPSN
jgi:hypothetical protein